MVKVTTLGTLGVAWLAATLGSPLGCSSTKDSTPSTTSTATTTTHSGGQGGSGATGGGGGQGGGAALEQFCQAACPDWGVCSGPSFPPSVAQCLSMCPGIFATCSVDDLAAALDCDDPNIDPNCNFNAFLTCWGAAGDCANWPNG